MSEGDWDRAPCGLLLLRPDGAVVRTNRTFAEWVGSDAELTGRRFSDLLTVGGRLYWETHVSPLLHVDRRVDEVALDLKTPAGRLPVLLSASFPPDAELVRVAVGTARERAGYERELVAARAAAERSAAQVTALQQVTAALSRAPGVDGVLDELRAASLRWLGAAAVSVWLRGPDERMVPHGGAHPSAALRVSVLAVLERAAVAHAGRVIVPLRGRTVLQGVLVLVPDDAAGAEPLDLDVLTAVGQQAGLALDRAQLYEQSASVAHTLQHSLLAGDPPADPRVEVAAQYRPGVAALEVGGDWHDAFLANEGVLAVVVGDVVGRGLGAASAMGQLRSALRAVAGPGVGPARLLSCLDRFVGQVEAARLATVAYGELDLASGCLRYACAGHLPPVLLPATGGSRLLWGGRSTPLGAYVREPRGESVVQLQPLDRLLLYTDGLVERRDRDLDEGIELLARTAQDLGAVPLPEAASRLTETVLRDEQGRDDACLLLLSWSGGRFTRDVRSDLSTLSRTRRDLWGWLTARGLADEPADDLVLATSEAVANAAEHGSRPDEEVSVSAWFEPAAAAGTQVVVQVRDRGRWRSATRSTERGRGLRLMEALVDDLVVETGDGTTLCLRARVQRRAS